MHYSALIMRLVGPLLLARAVLVLLDQVTSEAAAPGDKLGLSVTVRMEL
jgi:hypothetical protein